MTKEQINLAVAEVDGDEQVLALLNNNNPPNLWPAVEQYLRNMGKLYTDSHDAILPVIQRQYYGTKLLIEQELHAMKEVYFVSMATPEQICIALLKALNKWKE